MTESPDREKRFRQLVDRSLFTCVWGYCYRLTGNREDAEDLSQEAMTQAYLKLDRLRCPELIKGWIFSIVRTRYIDGLRRGRLNILSEYPDQLRAAEHNPEVRVIRDAVMSLPGLQREAIELFHFSELNLAETAQALGVSVNTVKQRLHRGRETLKRRLAGSFAAGDLEALL